MKVISLKCVLDILKEYSDFKGTLEKIDVRKPTHGSCCTCQDCGHYHDDCVCLHNEIVDIINKAWFTV